MNKTELKQLIKEVIQEGTWELPKNKNAVARTKSYISKLVVLQHEIYDLLGDDKLFDLLDKTKSRMEELINISHSETN